MSEPDYNPKMLSAKMKLLERFRARAAEPEADAKHRRLPPGQHQVLGFPVLDLGVRPPLRLDTWRLEVTGEVERRWFFEIRGYHDYGDPWREQRYRER